MVLGGCQRPACKPLGLHVRAASPQGCKAKAVRPQYDLKSLDSPFLDQGMLTRNQTYCGTEEKVPPVPLAVPKGRHLTTEPCRTLAAHQLQAGPFHLQQVHHFYFSQNITCKGKQLGILVSRKNPIAVLKYTFHCWCLREKYGIETTASPNSDSVNSMLSGLGGSCWNRCGQASSVW